jgi:hypothetical protein
VLVADDHKAESKVGFRFSVKDFTLHDFSLLKTILNDYYTSI